MVWKCGSRATRDSVVPLLHFCFGVGLKIRFEVILLFRTIRKLHCSTSLVQFTELCGENLCN